MITKADEEQVIRMVAGREPLIPGDQNSRRAAVLRRASELEDEDERTMFVIAAAACERKDPEHFGKVADELIGHLIGLCSCQRLN